MKGTDKEGKTMTPTSLSTRNILWSATAYFAACGLSAIFYPTSWLILSDLPNTISNELGLVFATLGAFMLALAFGAAISALSPAKHAGLILTLVVGNILDFCVTLKAVVAHQLPILNGGLFIVIAITWAVLLGIAYVNVKRHVE
jgi:hypothetical protein